MPIALTFDDGPDPRETVAVLDELDRLGAVATFFVIGDRVAAYPEVAREVLARGHAVQAHCHQHIAHPELSAAEIARDIDRLLFTLRGARLPRPSLWRPPYGRWTQSTLAAAGARGLQVVGWTLSTYDPVPTTTAEQTIAAIDAGLPRQVLHADSVVLMHDCSAISARPNNAQTVALIAPLVERVRARGWSLERLEGPVSRLRARSDDSVALLPGVA
jgi:peptidoglycan/xylan/chitin deacetylase (PgdA/CDA1 family)